MAPMLHVLPQIEKMLLNDRDFCRLAIFFLFDGFPYKNLIVYALACELNATKLFLKFHSFEVLGRCNSYVEKNHQ